MNCLQHGVAQLFWDTNKTTVRERGTNTQRKFKHQMPCRILYTPSSKVEQEVRHPEVFLTLSDPPHHITEQYLKHRTQHIPVRTQRPTLL